MTNRRNGLQTKEVQIGLIFAFGVSLLVWSETTVEHGSPIAGAMLLAGLLFSLNCIVIACWEQGLDLEQGFASAAGSYPAIKRGVPRLLLMHLTGTLAIGLLGGIPPTMCLALVGSDALMYGIFVRNAPPLSLASLPADAAVAIPPAVCLGVEMLR